MFFCFCATWYHLYVNLKYNTSEPIYETETGSWHREQTGGCQEGGGWGRDGVGGWG